MRILMLRHLILGGISFLSFWGTVLAQEGCTVQEYGFIVDAQYCAPYNSDGCHTHRCTAHVFYNDSRRDEFISSTLPNCQTGESVRECYAGGSATFTPDCAR